MKKNKFSQEYLDNKVHELTEEQLENISGGAVDESGNRYWLTITSSLNAELVCEDDDGSCKYWREAVANQTSSKKRNCLSCYYAKIHPGTQIAGRHDEYRRCYNPQVINIYHR